GPLPVPEGRDPGPRGRRYRVHPRLFHRAPDPGAGLAGLRGEEGERVHHLHPARRHSGRGLDVPPEDRGRAAHLAHPQVARPDDQPGGRHPPRRDHRRAHGRLDRGAPVQALSRGAGAGGGRHRHPAGGAVFPPPHGRVGGRHPAGQGVRGGDVPGAGDDLARLFALRGHHHGRAGAGPVAHGGHGVLLLHGHPGDAGRVHHQDGRHHGRGDHRRHPPLRHGVRRRLHLRPGGDPRAPVLRLAQRLQAVRVVPDRGGDRAARLVLEQL
ncbi:MAG: Undecaprenyl-diphosphatase, partial [uncultured Gemmatimonadetes bacterium]